MFALRFVSEDAMSAGRPVVVANFWFTESKTKDIKVV